MRKYEWACGIPSFPLAYETCIWENSEKLEPRKTHANTGQKAYNIYILGVFLCYDRTRTKAASILPWNIYGWLFWVFIMFALLNNKNKV